MGTLIAMKILDYTFKNVFTPLLKVNQKFCSLTLRTRWVSFAGVFAFSLKQFLRYETNIAQMNFPFPNILAVITF